MNSTNRPCLEKKNIEKENDNKVLSNKEETFTKVKESSKDSCDSLYLDQGRII